MSLKVAIVTNNRECEKRVQFYATLEKYLKINGFEVVGDADADRVLLCGCGFHDFMFGKMERAVADLSARGFSTDRLALLGCLPKTHAEQVRAELSVTVIPPGRERELDRWLGARVPFSEVEPTHIHPPADDPAADAPFCIAIARGCLQKCTFCVINRAKGALRSESIDAVLAQYRQALEAGHRRILLMGDDTFAYGLDRDTTVVALLDALLAEDDDVELHLGSLHLWWLVKYADDLARILGSGVVRELSVGLQHVNERLLRRMGRPVDIGPALAVVERLKGACPRLTLMADLMVGFPGETDEQFHELVAFCRGDTLFDRVSHFGYSDVRGAPAHGFDGKVDPLTIAMRWERLRQALGPRSLYNDADEDGAMARYRQAYRATFDQAHSYCRGTYREP